LKHNVYIPQIRQHTGDMIGLGSMSKRVSNLLETGYLNVRNL